MTLTPEEQAKAATRIGEIEGALSIEYNVLRGFEWAEPGAGRRQLPALHARIAEQRHMIKQMQEEANRLRVQVGLPVSVPQRPVPVPVAPVVNNDRSQAIAFAGVAALAIGVFLPAISAPILGARSFWGDGTGDARWVLGLAAISLILAARPTYRALLIPGVLSLIIIGIDFQSAQSRVDSLRATASDGLLGALAGTAQVQWGWAVLALGGVLLVASALRR